MFDKDLILKQLNAMSSEDIVRLVQEALIESNIEFSYADTGIIFDGLSNWDCCQFKFSNESTAISSYNTRTGYYSSVIENGRSTMFQVDTKSVEFALDKYTLVAA